jgi:hypothetical protein
MTMYQRYVEPNDSAANIGDAVEDFLEQQEETVPGIGLVRGALKRQDILGIVRMKNDPAEGKHREALKLMAEVRSYYDCK